MMTPTTDTINGWLILACTAIGAIVVVSCLSAAGAYALHLLLDHLWQRRMWKEQLEEDRRAVFGDETCRVVEVDGQPIRVRTDRDLDARDIEALTILARSAAARRDHENDRLAAEVHE